MALKAATTPLVIALTQGSADAFVQGSVLTGLSGRQAYQLMGIYFDFPNASAIAGISAAAEWTVTVTRRSKTAIPNLSDVDVLAKYNVMTGLTTSGRTIFNGLTWYWKPENEIALVEDTIYAQLDSTATTLTNVAVVRLDVDIDTISDIDRLNLIARSLT